MNKSMFLRGLKNRKKALSQSELDILKSLFNSLEGEPPHVDMYPFRVKYSSKLDEIDCLTSRDRLIWEKDEKLYISPHALPLIESARALSIIRDMDLCLQKLKSLYRIQYRKPQYFSEVVEYIGLREERFKEAVHYLIETGVVFGTMQNRFPYDENSHICLKEELLRYESVDDVFLRDLERKGYLKEKAGFYQNIKNIASKICLKKLKDHPLILFCGLISSIVFGVVGWLDLLPRIQEFLRSLKVL